MRRLTLFALALFLALAGVQLVIGPELFAPYIGRDAAFLWIAAAAVAALFAGTWAPREPAQRTVGMTRPGQIILGTGLVVALLSGVVQPSLTGMLGLSAQFAWWLGMGLAVAGAWWPGGRTEYAAPQAHWTKDAQGGFVLVGQSHATEIPAGAVGRRSEVTWLTVLLAIAAVLRFWNLAGLPAGCAASECVNGLRLVDGESMVGAASLFEGVARAWYLLLGSGVPALRFAAACFSLITVAAVWAAARRLGGAPAALLTALFVIFSPLGLWASRTSEPWVAVGTLVALAIWLTAEALVQRTVRWWLLAGLALGALFVQAPALRWATLLWLLVTVAAAGIRAWRGARRDEPAAIGAGILATAAVSLPLLFADGAPGLTFAAGTADQPAQNLALLVAAVLRADGAGLPAGVQPGLLGGLGLALAVIGIGALLRHVRQGVAAVLLAGTALYAWSGARLDGAFVQPMQVALVLLPFGFAAAAVALSQFLDVLVSTWRLVVAPRRLVGYVAVALGLVLVWNVTGLMADLDQAAAGGSQTEGDMARLIAQVLASEPDGEHTFILPGTATTHPSLRLLAGPALASGRILTLESARTLPYAGNPPGDLLYLLAIADGQVLRTLQQLYPGGVAFTELDSQGQRALFNVFRVPREAARAAQVAAVTVATDDNPAAASFLAPALDFAWQEDPPAAAPFVAQALASLVVPESDAYTFAAEIGGEPAGVMLTLDNMLVLDTSLSMTSQTVPLIQGVYTLAITYRSGATPGDLRITWQRPGSAAATIGGAALHWPAAPQQGMVAAYYDNERFVGVPIVQRKELVVGADPAPPLPYSVRWRGKLATPRSGEYLLGAAGAGLMQMTLDDRLLLDNSNLRTNAGAAGQEPGYVEGLIYLTDGWHELDVRFAPDAATSRLHLLWQPAGGSASELDNGYLLPTGADIATGDVPLPAAPPLVDTALGDDTFALSRVSTTWQPQQRIPPAAAAPLPLEALWSYGNGCGAAGDQLSSPHGLAFDPATRHIYVADTGNRRIAIVEPDGAPGGLISGDALQEPVDVAFAPDSGVPLILDNAAQQIFRYDGDNGLTPIQLQASFYRPRGFGVDPAGALVVADTGGGRMVILTLDGEQVYDFGGQGSVLARGQPVDAAAANGVYWVVSAEDGRLWKTQVDGSMTAVQPTNTIDGPQLAALSDGRLLLSDPARSTFWLLSAQGQPTGQFAYAGQFDLPTGIAALEDADGVLIAVSDTRRCTVSLWRLGDQG